MALPGRWVAVDIIGTKLSEDVFIHSAGGERVAKPFRRCARQLHFDRIGETAFRAVVYAALAGRELPKIDGLVTDVYQIDASDGTPVGLIVWMAAKPPTERPTYNAWVLDMTAMTTRTSGDDPSLIGDGRGDGEERHVQYLFMWLHPEDAWSMVGGYYDALTGDDGMLIQSYWSLRPQGIWVHMWSSCRLRVGVEGNRTLYGLTLKLDHRDNMENNISSLVRFSAATVLLVEKQKRIPITTVGKLAPLGEQRIAQVLEQVDLDELTIDPAEEPVEQMIEIDGRPFVAAKFALHSSREQHGDPVAIILLREQHSD